MNHWKEKVLIGLILFGYGVCIYWMYWPYKPIIIKEPMPVFNLNKEVNRGGTLYYIINADKRLAIAATITKQIIYRDSHLVITSKTILGNIGKSKFEKMFTVDIPLKVPTGEAVMQWTGVYPVNPMRSVQVVATTEPFWIR